MQSTKPEQQMQTKTTKCKCLMWFDNLVHRQSSFRWITPRSAIIFSPSQIPSKGEENSYKFQLTMVTTREYNLLKYKEIFTQ